MVFIRLRPSKQRRIATGFLIGLNLLIFGLFDPFSSPILVILLGFLLCFVDLMVLTYFGLFFVEALLPPVKSLRTRLVVSLGGLELLILALASLGQLTWWVVGVVTVIWVLAYFYSLYLKAPIK